MPYYAVARGRTPGVYSDWNSCKVNVDGYSRAKYKKFNSLSEAQEFANSFTSFAGHPAPTRVSKPATGHVTKPRRASTGSVKHEKIYVDGASRRNGQAEIPKLGYGVYYGPGDIRNVAVPLSRVDDVLEIKPTNQRAELHAMRHALRNIWSEVRKNHNVEKLYEILTDSSYCKNAIETWSFKWSQNGWKNNSGQQVANRDLIEESFDLYNLINSKLKVLLSHVPGHQGIAGNEAADQLANLGADQM